MPPKAKTTKTKKKTKKVPAKSKKATKKAPKKTTKKVVKRAATAPSPKVPQGPLEGMSDFTAQGIGKKIGSYAGGWLGGLAGKAFSSITGMGAYSIRSNTLATGRPPQFSMRGISNGSVEFCHSEFLQDVTSAQTLPVSFQIPINAGLYASNPFLSLLANQFEQFEFLGLVYQFKSTCGEAVASQVAAMGSVLIATNYDVLDTPFQNKQQMDAYMFCTSCKPTDNMIHPVECDPKQNALTNLYCRSGTIPTNSDQRFYDMGFVQVMTQGQLTSNITIGELWVSYHVRLLKPKLPTPLGANLLMAHIVSSPPATATGAGNFYYGTSGPIARAGSTYPVIVDGTSANMKMPVVGRYVIVLTVVSGAGFSFGALPYFSLGTNIVAVNNLNNNAGNAIAINNVATTIGTLVITVDVLAPGNGVANQMTTTGLTGLTIGNLDLFIMQISSGVTLTPEEVLQLRLEKLEARLAQDEEKSSVMTDFSYLSVEEMKSIKSLAPLFSPLTTTSAPGSRVGPMLAKR